MPHITFEDLTFEGMYTFSEPTYVPLKDQGLVLIGGEVYNSRGELIGANGAGKTTIPDALSHVLYETTGSGIKKNGLRNWFKPRDFKADLNFKRDSTQIRVQQGFPVKGSSYTKLWVDGSDQYSDYDKTYLAQRISTMSGMTSDQFFGTCYFSQAYTHAILKGSKAQRTKWLINLFGLNIYDEILEALWEYKSALEEDAIRAQMLEVQKEKALNELMGMGDPVALQELLDEVSAEIQTLTQEARKAQAEANALSVEYKVAEKQRATLGEVGLNTVSEAVKALKSSETIQGFLQKDLDEKSHTLAKLSAEQDLKRKRQKVEDQLNALPEVSVADPEGISDELRELKASRTLLAELKSIEAIPKGLKGKVSAMKMMEASVHTSISSLDGQLTPLNQFLGSLEGNPSECPLCSSHVEGNLEDQISAKVSDLLKKKAAYEENLKTITQTLNQLSPQVELSVRRETLEETLREAPTLDAVNSQIREAEAALEAARSSVQAAKERERLQAQLSVLPVVEGTGLDITTVSGEVDTLKHNLQGIRSKIAKLSSIDTREVGDVSLQEIQALETTFSSKTAACDEKRQRLRDIEQSLDRISMMSQSLTDFDELGEILEMSLENSTATDLAIEVIKELKVTHLVKASQALTDSLYGPLQIFYPNRSFEVEVSGSLQMELKLSSKKSVQHITKSLSGGEGQKLNLALMAGLMKASTATTTNLAIFDEPLRWLDEQTKEAFFFWLDSLRGGDSGLDTILMITHDTDVKAKSWDQQWTVKNTLDSKNRGSSVLIRN